MDLKPPSGIVNWFNTPIGERGWNAFRAQLTGKDYPGTSRKTSYVKLSEEEANEVIENIKKDPEGIPIFDEANAPDKAEEYQKWLVARYFTKARVDGFESRKQEGIKQLEEELGPEGLDELLNLIREESKVEVGSSVGGGGGGPTSSESPPLPPPSSALAVVPKSEDDLVEEEIDPRILELLGLEEVFDFTYGEYKQLLFTELQKIDRGEEKSTDRAMLLQEEFKRIKGKSGKFKVKKKKININAVLDRKQPSPPGAIVKADKLIPQPGEDLQKTEEKSTIGSENLQDDLINGIGNILESLITIRSLLQSQGKTEQQEAKEDRKETEKKKKKEREATLEKKKPKSPIIKAITKPIDDFFGAIKRFFTNVLLGSVVLGIFKWLKDPNNKKAIDDFSNFLENNAGLILGGLLAIAALPIATTLFGLTKTVLSGIGLIGGALGSLGKFILGIPGVAPFLGMTVLAPLASGLATGIFAKVGAPAIMDAATKLDLGVAAAQDPLVKEAYSKLKEEGKAYKITTGRGGKKVRVEKSTEEMTADEKKAWDDARSKEAKARELAVDFSRSNQELYDLKEKLKNLQKEKPRSLPRGRKRTQANIDKDIQSVKDQIKIKEKEKASKKKVLYDHLKIDSSKPQVQPQTPLMPGLPTSAAEPGTGPVGNQVGSSSTSSSLSKAAAELKGMSSAAGPDGGNNACVWAVNKVFARAGIKTPWGSSNYVPTAEQEMIKSGYQRVSSPSPGDIYVAPGEKHIGIVLDNGNIISNSSSGAKFSWEASPASYASYYGGSGRFYRIPSSVIATGQPSVDTAVQKEQAQVAQTTPPTPSIPSPTGRSNIIPLPIPTGSRAQQASSGTAPNQTPVPRFSSEDPNNTTTMVVRAIYNIVG